MECPGRVKEHGECGARGRNPCACQCCPTLYHEPYEDHARIDYLSWPLQIKSAAVTTAGAALAALAGAVVAALALHLSKQLAWELGLGVAARGRPTSIDASTKPSTTEAVGVEHNVVCALECMLNLGPASARRTHSHSVM
jgi:hypothetical protein